MNNNVMNLVSHSLRGWPQAGGGLFHPSATADTYAGGRYAVFKKCYTPLVWVMIGSCLLLSSPGNAQNDFATICARISNEVISQTPEQAIVKNLLTYQGAMRPDGSWPDIQYEDRTATNWGPIRHLERIQVFAAGYANPRSVYFGNNEVYQSIVKGLAYWYKANPKSENWWHNEIAGPQYTGRILAILSGASQQLPQALQAQLLERMKATRNPVEMTGANKLDIAIHNIARAAVTADRDLMTMAVKEAFDPIRFTKEEGLQYDYSFQQHKEQLQISSYGLVFLLGEYQVASWLAGTAFQIPMEKKQLLDDYFFNTFVKTIRGKYIDYNVEGRGISRKDILDKSGLAKKRGDGGLFANILAVSPEKATELNRIKDRLLEQKPASYQVQPLHIHFWKADYTVHTRPEYTFNVRTVSTRTVRTESGNNENMLGTVLPDGSVNLVRRGNEYYNIMPAWEWDKIPGVTARDYDTAVTMKKDWGIYGSTAFTGGVSDSLYGATVYSLNYDGVQAKKSYFFFDDEVVCLGAGISSAAQQPVTTTINQCWAQGKTYLSNKAAMPKSGIASFPSLSWVWQDSVGYFFPGKSNISISGDVQSGEWASINYGKKGSESGKVFKLWLNHGTAPQNASYEYIVVPGMSLTQADAYGIKAPVILKNSPSLQAVEHKNLKIVQAVFYESGEVQANDIYFKVQEPCVVQLRAFANNQIRLSIADPGQKLKALKCVYRVKNGPLQELMIPLPQAPYRGQTVTLTLP